jgi:hypothetical protein
MDLPVEIIVDGKSEMSASSQDNIFKYLTMKYCVLLVFFPKFDGGFNIKIRGQQNQIDSMFKAIAELCSVIQTEVVSKYFTLFKICYQKGFLTSLSKSSYNTNFRIKIILLKKSRTFQIQIDTSFDHVWFVRNHKEKITTLTGAIIRLTDIININEFPKKFRIWIHSSSLNVVYEAYCMINVSCKFLAVEKYLKLNFFY